MKITNVSHIIDICSLAYKKVKTMEMRIAALGLAHPFEVGFDQAGSLLEQTCASLEKIGTDYVNIGIVLHDYEGVKELYPDCGFCFDEDDYLQAFRPLTD